MLHRLSRLKESCVLLGAEAGLGGTWKQKLA